MNQKKIDYLMNFTRIDFMGWDEEKMELTIYFSGGTIKTIVGEEAERMQREFMAFLKARLN